MVTIGHREDIVINTGDLTPVKNGLEVIVEEASGSKYMIPLERDRNSTIFRGYTFSCNNFSMSCDNLWYYFKASG